MCILQIKYVKLSYILGGMDMEEENKTEVVDDENKFSGTSNSRKHKSYLQSLREVVFDSTNGFLFFLALVGFILFGAIGNYWYNAWILFFVPDIITSIIRAIKNKRLCDVNITFICCAVFFFVCMVCPGTGANLWHPMWVIFFIIPAWYIFFSKVDRNYHKDDDEVK